MPLNFHKAGGPAGSNQPDASDTESWPDEIQPAMDYLKSDHLKGKIGGIMRRELQAGNFGTAAEYLLAEAGWIRKADLKGSGQLGRELRDLVNMDRDVDAARARLRDATRRGFRPKQLHGRRGKILRELLNAGDREGAAEAVINFAEIKQDDFNGSWAGPVRKAINDDQLEKVIEEDVLGIWPDHLSEPPFRVTKKMCSGSLGGPVRRALNQNQKEKAARLIRQNARRNLHGPKGALGDLIKAALRRNDPIEAQRLVSEAVAHPPQEVLKGQVGNLIRHALRDQQPDRAEELLVTLARTMDPKGLRGKLGKQLRRKFNQGAGAAAVQLMYDWLVAKEQAHRRKKGAGGTGAATRRMWFGPPTATWAAKRAIAAVGRGEAPGEAIAQIRDHGGKGAIAAAFREYGTEQLRAYPGIGMVLVYCDFLADIPGVGDILIALRDQIDELVEDGVRKGAEAAADYVGGLF